MFADGHPIDNCGDRQSTLTLDGTTGRHENVTNPWTFVRNCMTAGRRCGGGVRRPSPIWGQETLADLEVMNPSPI